MTIKQLRAFIAVARTLSFAEASVRVHLSQPALSLAIKKLEESLGGRLFNRTTRTIALTPEGDALLPIAERLMAEWDNVEEELHQRFALQLGKIAVAAMPSFASSLLPQALLRYRELYPRINIEVHDVIAEQVVDMVRQNRVEVGVTFDPGASDDLLFRPLFSDEFIAVLPPGHPDAKRNPLPWQQLLQHDFITLQRPSSLRLLMERQLAEQGMAPRVAFEAHQLATVGRMVATGLGVSAVPALCRQQMQELGACCVSLDEPTISRRVGILTRSNHQLSVAARALIEVLSETFRK
ncbi:LysR family transcriptional regulator [Marinobacterium sedimentorum]|uniref:LysR family transcriptional regulator n=1 Tax=Marinobacterium sedimentorum TaxID=2927804 RepID=UPI0020C5C632|nr:LysR family transcriptional regulator [Marinobacterium sedimentorum]MCP8687230.1 LysR family transcriptional regulator [Marinobacterium sedimentorum]